MIPIATLLEGYRTGYFPMAIDGQIDWFSPTWRGILPLDHFHVPRRLTRAARQGRFENTVNRAFSEVIRACASRADPSGNWITEDIVDSYGALHEAGYAHSVETWSGTALVGGLYGVSLRGAFFGESMFHRASDASKLALCALVDRLRARGYLLLDIQWLTPHLEQFGAIEVPRPFYLKLLAEAMQKECALV
jgi:leucyl/phenylalanyl-tRNA--protein transferase